MLKKEIAALLNEQVNKEFYSAYFYLDMSNFFELKGLAGFANWFYVQAQEERDHAMLFLTYLKNNSEEVKLEDVKAPAVKFSEFKQPLEATLEHERYVTESIHNLYANALNLKDFRTMQFLDWFISEQGEEEKNAEDLINKFELFGRDGKGLYQLDSELAARVYAPPSLVL